MEISTNFYLFYIHKLNIQKITLFTNKIIKDIYNQTT